MPPGIRTLPFGYTCVNGRPEADHKEAELVRQIYEKYLEGASYNTLAEWLNLGDIPYRPGCLEWNKHMVKRILEDHRYLGGAGLPALVEASIFSAAETVRRSKTAGFLPPPVYAKLLRGRIVCAICGSRLVRDTKRYARWVCVEAPDGEGGTLHPAFAVLEDDLAVGIQALLNKITGNPALVAYPTAEIGTVSLEGARLANELRRELERRSCDEARAIALILAAAAEQYASRDSGEAAREAKCLRERFTTVAPQSEFDLPLFLDAVRQVAVHPGGHLSLVLSTGQQIADSNVSP